MKKTTQILTLLLTVFLSSQILFGQESKAVVDGFWGIKFGSSVTEARRIILAKKTGAINEKKSSKDLLFVENAEFADKKTLYIFLQFIDDKFYIAQVIFYPNLEPYLGSKAFELYKSVKKDINEKYYPTKLVDESFVSPYYDGDGFEASAIRLGKAKLISYWFFEQNDEIKTSIALEIDKKLVVTVTYMDIKLGEQSSQKQKNANAKDF